MFRLSLNIKGRITSTCAIEKQWQWLKKSSVKFVVQRLCGFLLQFASELVKFENLGQPNI